MTIAPGTKLGPYEILSLLGAGGMGEVWRARDARLNRDVAVKVLPGDLLESEETKERFEREARALAALNHPNVAAIYSFEEIPGSPGSSSRHVLVTELLEGQTLRDKLSGGALPVRQALEFAAQIALGLTAAHGKGILHRDLKPENVFLTRDGQVKLLDFGLAKTRDPSDASDTRAPTLAPATEPGVVMGTVAYMSPEQARGEPVDFRSDQFAFGSVLYEMLTGRRAFERKSAAETMAAIIREEPKPMAALVPGVPAPLRWLVERCLSKEPGERYAATEDLARDVAKAREHIAELSGGESTLSPGTRRRSRGLLAGGLAAAAFIVGLVLGFFLGGHRSETSRGAPVMQLNLAFPAEESLVPTQTSPILALSPDGMRLVYVGRLPEGRQGLYLRPLDRLEATAIPGTEGALDPFFSPDGQWVGFGAEGKLKKVSLSGGRPMTLCDLQNLRGASWGADGTILFSASGGSGLLRVSDKGGEPKPLTTLDAANGESTHRWPDILPGGKTALFTIHSLSGDYERARIGAVSIETGERRIVLEGGTQARYVPSGHIIYVRFLTLFAVPFDAKRLEVTGPPVPILDGLSGHPPAGFANYEVSRAGSLVYAKLDPHVLENELVWLDRKGSTRPLTEVRRPYNGDARFSPDGRRLAVSTMGTAPAIWIYDLTRNAWEQLTAGARDFAPVWSPDGRRIAFSSNRNGDVNLFLVPADRSAAPEQLTRTNTWPYPLSWSPDGRGLLVEESPPKTGAQLSELSLDGERTLRPLLPAPFRADAARLSSDGRWMAYQSDEAGRPEVYVMRYPAPGGRFRISRNGGSDPVWSPDGREIFFKSGHKLMAAAIQTTPKLNAGVPRVLFEGPFDGFDIAPDGQRLVLVRPAYKDLPPGPLVIVLGVLDDLGRRVPAGTK